MNLIPDLKGGHHAVPSTKTVTTRLAASGRNIPPKAHALRDSVAKAVCKG